MRIIAIGKATHLESHVSGWAVCGTQSSLIGASTDKVDCLRCRKTKVFRMHLALERCTRLEQFQQALMAKAK